MSLTPNFGMNIPDSTDVVNLLTQCYPNFTLLDGALETVRESGITTASETKSGTVHQLVRTDSHCNVIRFTATSNFVTGDSFTVDGAPVTGVAVNGTALQTGDYVINSNVLCILVGSVLTVFAGGSAALPEASDVDYDNAGSGLTATNVQDAIDEVLGDIPTGFAATAITYDNTGSGLTATDVQGAIDEIANARWTGYHEFTVTADGVQTLYSHMQTLWSAIAAYIAGKGSAYRFKFSGLNLAAYVPMVPIDGSYYDKTFDFTTEMTFTCTRVGGNYGTIQSATLRSTPGLYKNQNGTLTDDKNIIPTSGLVSRLVISEYIV